MMTTEGGACGPLVGLRVLDLTDEMGVYATKLLADLGADVIRVESPEGDSVRLMPPFRDGEWGINNGLFHWWMNTNKRSLAVDIGAPEGVATVKRLVTTADILIESGPPGRLDGLGLGYEELSAIRPALVYVSISPFGRTGAQRDYRADDLVLLAMGGLLYLAGHPDGPPMAAHGLQSYHMGSLFATLGALAACAVARATGEGQLVDVSIQECVTQALENAPQAYDLEGYVRVRVGNTLAVGDCTTGMFHCKDGLINLFLTVGGRTIEKRHWVALLSWMGNHPAVEDLSKPEWLDPEFRKSKEARERFRASFEPFTRTLGTQEAYETAQNKGILLCPVNSPADVMCNGQLLARNFFVEVEHPELGRSFTYPGAPYRLEKTPWSIRQCAPQLGEHNAEILAELERRPTVISAPARAAAGPSSSRRPLEGIRIADFTWVGAGSFATKHLADLGADVIKIESTTRPDLLRLAPPYAGKKPGLNRSGYFSGRNTSKRDITLNMNNTEGIALARRIILASDVVINNYRPGAMEKWGFSYEEIRALKPEIIYASMPAQGKVGPHSVFGGYGTSIFALSGLYYLSGDPAREPTGTGTNYPDHVVNPVHTDIAIVAALRHREDTGEGQEIEVAQIESTVNAVATAIMGYTVNGEVLKRTGNRNGRGAPHGVFRCAGDDRWCAIAVGSEAEWESLCRAVGHPEWSADLRFATLGSRLEHQDELEVELERWTRERDPYAVMEALQSAGVPAGVVQDARDLIERDPSLRERHWVYLDHPEMGRTLYDAPPYKLSKTPAILSRPAPLLGQHTAEVLREVLGLTDGEIERYQEAGALK